MRIRLQTISVFIFLLAPWLFTAAIGAKLTNGLGDMGGMGPLVLSGELAKIHRRLAAGQVAEAKTMFQHLSPSECNTAAFYFVKGELEECADNPTAALGSFTRVAADCPNCRAVYLHRAQLCLGLSDGFNALAQANMLINLGDSDGLGRLEKARAYKILGDALAEREALKGLNDKLFQGAFLQSYLVLHGEIELSEAKFTEGLATFKRAVALNPTPAALAGLGSAYYSLADYAKCVEVLERADKIQPGNPTVLFDLARAYGHLGQMKRGVELTTKLIELQPGNIGPIRERAAMYVVLDRKSDAEKDLARLQKIAPQKHFTMMDVHGASVKYTGDITKLIGQTLDAGDQELQSRLSELESAASKQTTAAQRTRLLEEIAELELMHGKYNSSLGHLSEAEKLGDQSYRLHSIRAGCLLGLHKPDLAKSERALTVHLYVQQKLQAGSQ